MSLKDTLTKDMKVALKARERAKLTVIRALIAGIRNEEIKRKGPLDEAAELAFLSTQAKRRREARDAFRAGDRDKLADTEAYELTVIETYLPKQLTADEVKVILETIIKETGAEGKKDFGRVMGALMPKIRGQFPGKDVKPLVEAALS